MQKLVVDKITRPCKKCGRNIRWGTKDSEGKAVTERHWMARCYDCESTYRKTAGKTA